MNSVRFRFLLMCFAGVFACNSSNIKRNQTPVEASKNVSSADTSDPVLFVETWVLLNAKDLGMKSVDKPITTVERLLFNGKSYEAVVTISDRPKESFLVSFRKENSKWIFLSQRKIALDHGWPAR